MTDWASIRKLMNTAIDTCEKIDQKIGSLQEPSIKNEVDALCKWYEDFCAPSIEKVMKAQD